MTNEEKIALLEKLADNDAFLADIAKAESKDQLQEAFANYDLELTCEEVDAFVAKLNSETAYELNESRFGRACRADNSYRFTRAYVEIYVKERISLRIF